MGLIKFKKIIFSDDGTLRIKKEEGEDEVKNLLTAAVWLYIADDWEYKIDDIAETPAHTAIVPFSEGTDLGELRFGMCVNKVEIEQVLEKGTAPSPKKIAIGGENRFCMGFIGTDDLRNGKVNSGIIDIQNKYVNLSVFTDNEGKRHLKIGFQHKI